MRFGGFGKSDRFCLCSDKHVRAVIASSSIDNLHPYDDQWGFLSSLPRLDAATATQIVADAETRGRVLGVRMPIEDEKCRRAMAHDALKTPGSKANRCPLLPEKVSVVVADQIYIDRTHLPSAMIARLIRLAAFQNPEFYRAQAMRLPTFGKPRIISCAELHMRHVGLPRGCLDEVVELIRTHGAEVETLDRRWAGNPLPTGIRFQGALHDPQIKAFDALAPHEYGVLSATTAFRQDSRGSRADRTTGAKYACTRPPARITHPNGSSA